MKGYKATDANMQCRGFQFELGRWFDHEGPIEECKSGFHFCEQPSGVWAYYSEPGTRVFEVEAEGVLDKPPEPGADVKRVCKRIRFVREIEVGGDRNTGDRNTGYDNTGYGNTGYGNTGDRNTGYGNTGYDNTGYGNTGNRNTGDRNTGDRNTGDYNTGNRNTGDYNTGNRNTGNRNTGYGNACNWSSGYFCIEEPKVICFDVQTDLTRQQFVESFPEWYALSRELKQPMQIEFATYSRLPGITPEKLKALHQKHLAGVV